MMKRFPCALSLYLLASAAFFAGSPLRAQEFALRSSDRVTFYGDSITAQRYYTRDVQDFVATRYPELNVTFHNAGVPGDKVTGGYDGDAALRVARDVAPWNPTMLTVMLGMNDGDYMSPDSKIFTEYQTGYEKLLGMLRKAAPKARIILLENTPYDEITHGTEFTGYMATTEQNAKATPALGHREGLPVVDVYSPVKQFLEKAKSANPSFASLLVTDRIHPSETLHWIIAAAIMKAWHVDPVVSAVTISAPAKAATQSQRTTVSGLSGSTNTLEWDQLDEALPLPFDFENELLQFVVKESDLAACDQEMLTVKGLPRGEYKLTIDKDVVGTFSAEQLGAGINLALYPTPMWNQAREYDGALHRRSQLEDSDFILEAETKVADRSDASRVLRAAEAEFEQKAQVELHLLPHHYNLSAISK